MAVPPSIVVALVIPLMRCTYEKTLVRSKNPDLVNSCNVAMLGNQLGRRGAVYAPDPLSQMALVSEAG